MIEVIGNGRLIHGDCIREMKELKENSIDFVLTDPPFNVGLEYEGINDSMEDYAYSVWCMNWLTQMTRVMKEGSYAIVFTGDKKLYWLAKAITDLATLEFHHFFKWYKPNAQGGLHGTNFFNRVGLAFVLSKGKANIKSINRKTLYQDIVICNSTKSTDKDAVDHPARRPVSLYKHIIQGFTKEGDTVLDCFLGSGTTGIACESIGRKWVGIELVPKYVDICKKRITKESKQFKLIKEA